MTGEEMVRLPGRPDSVADWEDLLVRLEIVPRVVRHALDEVVDATAAAGVLAEATEREARVGELLEAASRIGEPSRSAQARGRPGDDATALALRFASLRARTFAMVQRRGLEVWEWGAQLPRGERVTVHQLLLWLAREDGRLLARLRSETRNGRGGC